MSPLQTRQERAALHPWEPWGPRRQIPAPFLRPGVHWAALRGPPSPGVCPLRRGSWALTLCVPPPSSGLSWGHSVSGRKRCRFAARETPPKRPRGPGLPRSRCRGCSGATGPCTRHAAPRTGRARTPPAAPRAQGRWPRGFLSATRPAAAPPLAARPSGGHWSAVPILHRPLWANRRVAPTYHARRPPVSERGGRATTCCC